MAPANTENQFLRPPSDEEYTPVYRAPSTYNPLHTFQLPSGQDRHYQQQYGDMYFLRLAKLKPAVEEIAVEAWDGFSIAGEHARRVERVLDVRQGELCWVAGTIYMDMPMKPNILDDLTKEATPPPRPTYLDPAHPELTQIMLEDESGRLRLVGSMLRSTQLATGAIVAVLGTENANGDFEVIDIKVPDLPRQPRRWERDGTQVSQKGTGKGKIAFVSGLGITGSSGDTLSLDLLTDYLLGYTGSSWTDDENTPPDASIITRLVIAGNSLGASMTTDLNENSAGSKKKGGPKKYGYDASAYNASPITQFDTFLAEILPSIPITLMSGASDPANFSLPQQGIHRAMFPRSRAYCSGPPAAGETPEPGWFDSVTNPWEGDVEGWRLWGSSGQNVDDVLRYLDFASSNGNVGADGDSEARIKIMEAMLRWRCGVPTAPDTIWSYPFQTHDPFVMQSCPHLFFAGNQPQFRTAVIEGDAPLKLNGADTEMTGTDDDASGPRVRLLSIPTFKTTGELVLVDAETLEVEVVKFGTYAVPYSKWHVPQYHEWMKDEVHYLPSTSTILSIQAAKLTPPPKEIQEATASEPLTLEEEYNMQQSWRQDPDKLTFIVCLPAADSDSQQGQLSKTADTPDRMIGDINLFLRVDNGEEGTSEPQIIGEVELMIAEKKNQRKGLGKATLLTFLR
ncbi:hypothetical protein BBP40_008328, partial [Aspergillus hancockii]